MCFILPRFSLAPDVRNSNRFPKDVRHRPPRAAAAELGSGAGIGFAQVGVTQGAPQRATATAGTNGGTNGVPIKSRWCRFN